MPVDNPNKALIAKLEKMGMPAYEASQEAKRKQKEMMEAKAAKAPVLPSGGNTARIQARIKVKK